MASKLGRRRPGATRHVGEGQTDHGPEGGRHRVQKVAEFGIRVPLRGGRDGVVAVLAFFGACSAVDLDWSASFYLSDASIVQTESIVNILHEAVRLIAAAAGVLAGILVQVYRADRSVPAVWIKRAVSDPSKRLRGRKLLLTFGLESECSTKSLEQCLNVQSVDIHIGIV